MAFPGARKEAVEADKRQIPAFQRTTTVGVLMFSFVRYNAYLRLMAKEGNIDKDEMIQ